jgi:hypothetical protein
LGKRVDGGFAVVSKVSLFSTLKALIRGLLGLVLIHCSLLDKRHVSNTTFVIFHNCAHEKLILKVLAFIEFLQAGGKVIFSRFSFLDFFSKPLIVMHQLIIKIFPFY